MSKKPSFTRFVCRKCGGWLWTENCHLAKPGQRPKINKTLRCIACCGKDD